MGPRRRQRRRSSRGPRPIPNLGTPCRRMSPLHPRIWGTWWRLGRSFEFSVAPISLKEVKCYSLQHLHLSVFLKILSEGNVFQCYWICSLVTSPTQGQEASAPWYLGSCWCRSWFTKSEVKKHLLTWKEKYGNHILDLRRRCKHGQYYNCQIEFNGLGWPLGHLAFNLAFTQDTSCHIS